MSTALNTPPARLNLRKTGGLLLVWCLALGAFSSRAASLPDFSEAAAILRRGIQEHAFPGCTVVVGDEDRILWSAALGELDYEHKVPVAKDTLYDLASVTKVTGTTSVYMQLVARGQVRMTDPVSQYLPEFIDLAPTEEDKAQRRQITVEHLLTHTSGLTAWKPYYRTHHTYAEMLKAILKTPLESAPGAQFRYSDFGMFLAGEVAARAGKKPLAELEQELVFKPLGMTNTMRNPPATLRPRCAPTEKLPDNTTILQGIVHDENSRAGEGLTGHAGLFSTAEDLGKLGAELLRVADGKTNWLSKPVLDEFIQARPLAKRASRGLGWGVEGGPQRAISHNGFTGTYIRVELSRKMYLVLLTNRVHPTRDNDKLGAVRREFIDAVLRTFDQSIAAK